MRSLARSFFMAEGLWNIRPDFGKNNLRRYIQVLEVVVADVLRALIDAGQIDGRAARQFAEVFADQVNVAPFRYQTGSGANS